MRRNGVDIRRNYIGFGFVDRQEAVRTEGKYIELLPGKVSKGAL